jgi:hypothetical protein
LSDFPLVTGVLESAALTEPEDPNAAPPLFGLLIDADRSSLFPETF